MNVLVHVASLVVNGKKVRITKSVAKQFPVDYVEREQRVFARKPVPKAICKVDGKVLGHNSGWFVLVPDAVAGLKWCLAATSYDKTRREQLLADGIRLDDLAAIPTVVL